LTEATELDNGDTLDVLPNGMKHQTGVKSLLGNGVVIDAGALLKDIDTCSKNGIDYKGRLLISDRCNLVTALHKEVSKKLHEIRKDPLWLGGEDVTASFKAMKMGLRMSHMTDSWKEFEDKYHRIRGTCEKLFRLDLSKEDMELDLDNLKRLYSIIEEQDLVLDTVVHLNKELKNKKRFLVEGAASSIMDVDLGLYPFTESYHTHTGAVCTGLGVPEEAIETTIGVFSAVSIIENALVKRIEDFPTHISP
jgi:adenylosuccinate synthase